VSTIHGAAGFVSSRSTLRGTGAIGQTRPSLPECFRNNSIPLMMMMYGMATMNMMMMMMIGRPWRWRGRHRTGGKKLAFREERKRTSIRSGEHSCWQNNLVVYGAQETNPRANTKHMERAKVFCRVHRNHICRARTNTYASARSGMSIRAGRHHAIFRSKHSTLATTWGGLERRLCFVLVSANQTKPREIKMRC
jgi:hypothetical protein